jgi:proteasome lid subunit RPN8/RPN11
MISEAQKYLDRFPEALSEAHAHARAAFPEESCGFIVSNQYIPMKNMAADPALHTDDPECPCRRCAFKVADAEYLRYASALQAVVHSHPNGPAHPSRSDMLHQVASNVTWIILTLDETRYGPTIVWGGDCPMEPLLGREFVHGVTDCYALIRDVFAIGTYGMAAQGMEWPLDPVLLPVGEREDSWWTNDTHNNLYEDNYRRHGFIEIKINDVRPGDAFLGKIRSNRLNHGGVLLGGNLILHHLPNRLSRREPAGVWSRCADKWLRYVGKSDA